MDESAGRFEAGMRIRREVLGSEHASRSMEDASELMLPMQELVTEYCWGTIWTRPGLARRDRSLVNIGMMVALNRPHELSLHVRGALANGCTREEIQEVLLQAAVYCGIPAGIEGFRVADRVLTDTSSAQPPGAKEVEQKDT